ncbi:PH domain-containing protein [Fundidesulfovibrio magnetotacticus]|uniref:PH domain-containing protein n=1 Tax=Fundidesulfovibrio magnetotacticus TaxID=2730080 RepID=UPI001C276FF9|nr:PH domain-containing protein [Fundidesulfovibrio magnetotacticus]
MEKNLLAGESIVYRANVHWVVFAWPGLWLALAAALFTGPVQEARAAGLAALALAAFTGLGAYIRYATSEFALTDKRVLVKVGFIRRTSFEVLLKKVEGIQVDQGILGRILGYGTIVVSGTGGTREPFHRIADPLAFRRRVQEEVDRI